MTKFIRVLKSIFFAMGLLLILVACSHKEESQAPIRSVRVLHIGSGENKNQENQFSGVVQAHIETILSFRIPGKITERPILLGQHVVIGQVLAKIDPQDIQLAEKSANAQMTAAGNALKLAEDNYQRFETLKKESFISSAELEKYANMLKGAQAQYQQAKSESQIKSNQFQYATLKAGASGVLTSVNAQVGQVVAAGTPIVSLAQDGSRDVVFSVPENILKDIKIGMPMDVKSWSDNRRIVGKVREIAASADPSTRTFVVKVAIGANDNLALGSTVSVTMLRTHGGKDALISVPTSALFQDGQATAVWVVDPMHKTVAKRDISIHTADGNSAIVSSGITVGDIVVTAGIHELHAGQHVMIYNDSNSDSSVLIAPVNAN
jgi:membrane fusion protein, multidrug efflux system